MKFDFFIQNINFKFAVHGKSNVRLIFNGKSIRNFRISKNIKKINTVQIIFSKENPADVKSFAVLERVDINGFNCVDKFKTLPYKIDRSKHNVKNDIINNNLYFGYVGSMEFDIEHADSKLSQAAWTIAYTDFEEVKWPLKGDLRRLKNFDNVYRDAKFLFTGCQPPLTKEIIDTVDTMRIKDLRMPLDVIADRKKVEDWFMASKRFSIEGLEHFEGFVPANGVTDCLRNFINKDNLYMPKKMYFLNGEMLTGRMVKDVFTDEIKPKSNVIFEYPSPWYSNEQLDSKIKEAKDLGCYIALDLTWLPMAHGNIKIDLDGIDEVFMSMNKAWPVQDIRPAFRWSRKILKDDLDLQLEYCSYTKINVQVFMKLLEKYGIDYTYDRYEKDADYICEKFNLNKTSVLWFTKHPDYKHDQECHISDYYYLDDFVCIRELLAHKGKYMW